MWPRPGNWGSRKAAAEAGVEGHGKDARRTQGRGKVKGEGQRGGTEVKSERARWRGRERQVRKRERRGEKTKRNGDTEELGEQGWETGPERGRGNTELTYPRPWTRAPTSPSAAGWGALRGGAAGKCAPLDRPPPCRTSPVSWISGGPQRSAGVTGVPSPRGSS